MLDPFKFEANTNIEYRNTKQIRNTNIETRNNIKYQNFFFFVIPAKAGIHFFELYFSLRSLCSFAVNFSFFLFLFLFLFLCHSHPIASRWEGWILQSSGL